MNSNILNPVSHIRAFGDIVALLTKHKSLTWEMTKRELTDKYAGQVFGTAWIIGHPVILMAVYIFVFCFIFRAKVGGTPDMPFNYPVYLLSGLIPWLAFQEVINKSCSAITSNSSLVKQIIFPIEILPVKGVIASFAGMAVTIIILASYTLIIYGYLPWTYALLPVLIFFQGLCMRGFAYILSAVGAFLRDIKDFVQVFCLAGIYVMPIFFLPAWVPLVCKPILYINPFSYMVWCYQDVLYFGRFEHPWAWPIFILGSLISFYIGYWGFSKLKVFLGNVL